MWNKSLDDELIELINEHGTKWKLLSEFFSVTKTPAALRLRWQQYLSDNPTRGKPDYMQIQEPSNPIQKAVQHRKHQFNRDGSETDERVIPEEALQTRESLMIAHGYNPNEFEIVNSVSNYWDSNAGEGNVITLYQSKLTLRAATNKVTEERMLEVLSREVKELTCNAVKTGDRNLIIPLADLHFGITKLEHTKEKINEIIAIINKGFKTIVIEQLGDLFHSSQMKTSQTLKGTMLDDVDMVQAIEDAKTFYHAVIDASLKNAKEVRIEHAAGNHSGNMEYMFLVYLQAKYPQLDIRLHNECRTAYLLDQVGVLVSHGDTAQKKLPMLFAQEFKDIWTKATTMEIHTGHYHTQEKDLDGVILRQMGTVKPNDLYEIEHGWTTGKKVIQLIEYSSNKAKTIHEI